VPRPQSPPAGTEASHGAPPRVVIVGAGFAGLTAAKALAARGRHRSPVQVTLVDRHDHHTFTPFLYQVATALLEPSGAAHPVRSLMSGLSNVEFRLAEVTGFNFTLRRVETDRGPIAYDYLIVAVGAVNDYFHNADIAARSFGLNDLGAAQALRNQVLTCFEAATWAAGPAERARQLTFAVVGGGPTGVEFSAALSVLIAEMAGKDFPDISSDEPTIVLIEGSKSPLGSFAPDLQGHALDALVARGVHVESSALVTDVDNTGLVLKDGRRIEAATVIWAAGVRANPLAGCFASTGTHGRVIVGPSLQVERHREVFVVGDAAEIQGRNGALPMLVQVAIQSGRHAAASVLALRAGKPVKSFSYRDLGTMAVLGRGDAVAQIHRLHLRGLPGWLAWLVLHIVRTNGLQTKVTVLVDWVSGLLFADRPVRLITGPAPPPTPQSPQADAVQPHGPRSDAVQPGTPPPDHEQRTAGSAIPTARAVPARADLPSVSVANAHRYGRVAALSWWSQDYPGLRAPPEPETPSERRRRRVERLRHLLSGDKSKTTGDGRL
jgi:NADH dehydrogenase